MYQRCPTCKSKGLFKKEICPTCLGERIVHKKSGLPPSKYIIPFTPIQPYIPYSPCVPSYPWTNPIMYQGGIINQNVLGTTTNNLIN